MSKNFDDREYVARCSENTLQTNSKGFFLDFADRVITSATKEWISNFGKLKTDEERIEAIYQYEPVRDSICNTLSHVQEIYRKKSAEVSQKRRIDSEKLAAMGNLDKALILASQSVLRAPTTGENPTIDDGFTLSLSYWNRALILITMKKYRCAIRDLQIAMKEGFSEERRRAEAFCKLGLCYQNIGDRNRAEISYELAKSIDTQDNVCLNNISEYKAMKEVEDKSNDTKVIPKITGKCHAEYPNACHKLDIKEDKEKGRYAIAKENMKTGETIVVEEPYAACLLPEYFGTHCHHCFERLIAPVGCPTCSSLAFCSPECRDTALKTYHQYECHFLDLLIGSGMSILSHTALRMVTQKPFLNNDTTSELAQKFCTNAHLRSPEDFLQRTLMATFLLRILQLSGYFGGQSNEDVIPDEIEIRVGARLLHYLQLLQFNAHEIYETRMNANQTLKDARPTYIGVALYPTVALFNHECCPAVTRYFVGNKIVIKTVRPLKPGEVVGENYGPMFIKKPLQDRQKYLKVRYWFDCQCQACTQDWPTYKSGLEMCSKRLMCPTQNCTNFFTLPIRKETIVCPRCSKKVQLSKSIQKFKEFERLNEKAAEAYSKENYEVASKLLCTAIDTFYTISLPPQNEVHIGQELLRSCWADFGNIYTVN